MVGLTSRYTKSHLVINAYFVELAIEGLKFALLTSSPRA